MCCVWLLLDRVFHSFVLKYAVYSGKENIFGFRSGRIGFRIIYLGLHNEKLGLVELVWVSTGPN